MLRFPRTSHRFFCAAKAPLLFPKEICTCTLNFLMFRVDSCPAL